MSLPAHKSQVTKLRVLKRFEFEGKLMRSGVVVEERDTPGSPALLFVRGAPTKVAGLVGRDALPRDFQQVLLSHLFTGLQSLQGPIGADGLPLLTHMQDTF